MDAPAVPDTLAEALSPAWLTAALGQRYPSVEVDAVEPGPVVSRVSTNARFRIGSDADLPAGLPAALCVKGYFGPDQVASRPAGLPEALFYRDLASRTGVRTLPSFYADVDPVSHHGVVITADVVEGGGTFLDALSTYSPDQAAASLEQYAVLHASTWDDGRILDAPWLGSRLGSILQGRGPEVIDANFDGPIGAAVPDEVRNTRRLVGVATHLADRLTTAGPRCLLHGDAHLGNTWLDAARRPCLVDWQLVQRGPWYVDVGYHIASALTVADRRTSEHDLLRHYLDHLTRAGVDVPEEERAWRSLSSGIVYGLYLWSITMLVAPPVTTEMLRRLGTAAADHGAYDTVTAG